MAQFFEEAKPDPQMCRTRSEELAWKLASIRKLANDVMNVTGVLAQCLCVHCRKKSIRNRKLLILNQPKPMLAHCYRWLNLIRDGLCACVHMAPFCK